MQEKEIETLLSEYYRTKDRKIKMQIFNHYKRLIKYLCVVKLGINDKDLLQEGYMYLWEYIDKYNPNKNINFLLFLNMNVYKKLLNYVYENIFNRGMLSRNKSIRYGKLLKKLREDDSLSDEEWLEFRELNNFTHMKHANNELDYGVVNSDYDLIEIMSDLKKILTSDEYEFLQKLTQNYDINTLMKEYNITTEFGIRMKISRLKEKIRKYLES